MRKILAGLRVYVGLLWLTYGCSKLERDWVGGKREFLEAVKFSASSTGQPFRAFLEHVVIPNQELFGQLIAFGETLVGIALVLGLLTKAGAAGGTFLSISYYFATGKYLLYFGIESLELLLFVVCLFLLLVPSNEALALDALIERRLIRRSKVKC